MTTLDELDIDTPPHVAARALVMDLGEVESEIAPLARQRDAIRGALSRALERCDGRRVVVDGFGQARLMDGAMVKRWNEERLAHLCAWLRDTDREEVAEMIQACREEVPRAGGLRVAREVTAR